VNSGSAQAANDFRPPITREATWVEDLASGVFFNRAREDYAATRPQPNALPPPGAFSPDSGPIMTAEYITEHDGLSYTMLLSENLQAGGWACDPRTPGLPMQSEFQMRAATSFVWYVTGQQDNQLPVSAPVAQSNGFDPSLLGINRRSDLETPLPEKFSSVPASNYGGLAAARPSANHSGGVNVAYCGGNVGYLSEDIDYRVLTQLMTPSGREVVVDRDANGELIRAAAPAGSSPRVVTPWTYEFDESEL
jgi:prepilin-type processing-associated H-X9-DG protein